MEEAPREAALQDDLHLTPTNAKLMARHIESVVTHEMEKNKPSHKKEPSQCQERMNRNRKGTYWRDREMIKRGKKGRTSPATSSCKEGATEETGAATGTTKNPQTNKAETKGTCPEKEEGAGKEGTETGTGGTLEGTMNQEPENEATARMTGEEQYSDRGAT